LTSLTFYGGVNEIGGNKILLEDKDTKIFLDFGKGFTSLGNYFEQFLAPRTSNGILDFITMGLVPDIPGIYRDDLMFKAGREIKEPEVDAVIISHAHADHVDYASFLHRDIPLYMGHSHNKSAQKSCSFITHLKPNLERGVSIQVEVLFSISLIFFF